jgi:hypothetical protein
MAEVIESGVGTYNYVPHAKGVAPNAAAVTVGTNRPKAANGSKLKANKRTGKEEYVDGNRFGSPTPYTEGTGGEVGDVVSQVQPENGGLFPAKILGVDVVTGASDPYTHTIASTGTGQNYGGWFQKVGSAVGPVRQLFWDAKFSKMVWECGNDQYIAHLTKSIMALKAGQIFTVDPTKGEDTSDPYLWSESDTFVSFDGTALTEVNGEVLEIDTGMEAYYANNIEPVHLVEKKGSIVRTLKAIFTDVTILKFYKALYNDPAPVAGTRPVKDIFYANVVNKYQRSATRSVQITTPKVAIEADNMEIGPQAEGGVIPVELGGACLKSGASAALTIVALSADATTYA